MTEAGEPVNGPGDVVRSGLRGPLVVLGVALLARVLWALAVPVVPTSDAHAYHVLAESLAAGRGYAWPDGTLTAFWPVGTSAFYSAFYAAGLGAAGVVAANLVLGLALVALVMRLGAVFFSPRAGVVAGLLIAVWPSLIQFTTVLQSELLFAVLMLLALWIWSSPTLPAAARALCSGLVVGVATLVRPNALPFPVIFAGAEAFRAWTDAARLSTTPTLRGVFSLPLSTLWAGARGPALRGVACLVVVFAVVTPWNLRNERVFGESVFVSANGGAVLWMGNNPDSTGGYMPLPESTRGLNDAAFNRVLGQQAREHIRAEPLLFLKRSLRRIVMLYDRETIGVVWNDQGIPSSLQKPLKAASTLFWWAVAALSVVGLWRFLRQQTLLTALANPVFSVWLYLPLIYVVTCAMDRYHLPQNALTAFFAAGVLVSTYDRVTARGPSRPAA